MNEVYFSKNRIDCLKYNKEVYRTKFLQPFLSFYICYSGIVKYIGALARKRLGLVWVSDRDVQHVFGVLKTNGVGQGRVDIVNIDIVRKTQPVILKE